MLQENSNSNQTDESSGIAGSISDSTSNEDDELTPTISALVSHIFLANLRDVKLLKVCRLVCKTWNIEACASLRVCCTLCIREDWTDFSKIRNLLLERDSGPLNLPSPFQNFRAAGQKFSKPEFTNLFLLPNINVTSLSFQLLGDEPFPSTVGLILAANQNNITDLAILVRNLDPQSNENLLVANEEIKPKALKNFAFNDDCEQCIKHIDFLKDILSKSKPEKIVLIIRDEKILINLLTQERVDHLKHLTIWFWEPSQEAIKHLRKLRFIRGLKSLTLMALNLEKETSYRQELHLFYQSVSHLLKDFTSRLCISPTFDLRFPCLEEIMVWNNTVLSTLTPNSFPALSKVSLGIERELLSNLGNDVIPHHGVQTLEITMDVFYMNDSLFDQHLPVFLSYLNSQFPKVSKLAFETDTFNCSNLIAIRESFPKLTTLDLNGRNTCPIGKIRARLERSCSNEEIPHGKSNLDFMELENILLGQKFVVEAEVLTHCIPRHAKLRRMSLYWNPFLSVELLQECVGHLEKIDILVSPDCSISEDDLTKISELLPNVHLQYLNNVARRCSL